jgi:hypothetical protein
MLFALFSTGGFKKTILFSGFKNPYKKICETRKLKSIHEKHFVERKKGVENQKNLRLDFMSKTLTKNAVQ